MKILITGASGFIGSHLTEVLQEEYPEHELIGWDKEEGDLKYQKEFHLFLLFCSFLIFF